MNGEENIDQAPKSNNTLANVHENSSQEQTIEQLQTQSENMEVHHNPNVEKKNFKEYSTQFNLLQMPSEATQFTTICDAYYNDDSSCWDEKGTLNLFRKPMMF